jgi:dipeptidyl aminopeptidase/acylaminoacyl peptidase
MKRPFVSCALLLCAAVAPAATGRKASIETVLSDLADVTEFRSVAVSPDGRRVAWAKRIRDRKGAWRLSAVEIGAMGSPAGSARRVTAAADGRAHDERDPAWSPDGKRLAFLSDAAKDGQAQLWVAPADGGPARKLTSIRGQLEDPRWSPDGKSIAVLFVEGSAQQTGALTAYKPDAGVVQESIDEQRIAVVEVASGRIRVVSPANLYVYDYDWSPDGKAFAAEAAEGSGTNN